MSISQIYLSLQSSQPSNKATRNNTHGFFFFLWRNVSRCWWILKKNKNSVKMGCYSCYWHCNGYNISEILLVMCYITALQLKGIHYCNCVIPNAGGDHTLLDANNLKSDSKSENYLYSGNWAFVYNIWNTCKVVVSYKCRILAQGSLEFSCWQLFCVVIPGDINPFFFFFFYLIYLTFVKTYLPSIIADTIYRRRYGQKHLYNFKGLGLFCFHNMSSKFRVRIVRLKENSDFKLRSQIHFSHWP